MNYFIITVYILICFILAVNEKRIKSRYRVTLFIFISILFSLEFAFRDIYKTRDTYNYVEIFNAVSISDGLFESYDRYEPGFCFINRIVKLIIDDYKFLLFVVSFCIFMLWLWVLKLYQRYMMSNECATACHLPSIPISIYPLSFLAVYIPYFGLLYNSIALRAGLEIALLYVSILLCLNNKYVYAIVVYLITITIHQSAIIALPLLILAYKKIKFTKITATRLFYISLLIYVVGLRRVTANFASFIISALSSHFPELLIFSWSDHYMDNGTADYGISLFRLSFYFLAFFLIYNEKSKRVNVFTSLTLISLIICALFGGFSILNRFIEMFLISCCISININLNNISSCLVRPYKIVIFILIPMILFYCGYLSNCL